MFVLGVVDVVVVVVGSISVVVAAVDDLAALLSVFFTLDFLLFLAAGTALLFLFHVSCQ